MKWRGIYRSVIQQPKRIYLEIKHNLKKRQEKNFAYAKKAREAQSRRGPSYRGRDLP